METTFACACCGRLRPLSGRVNVGSDILCWSCAEEHTILCDRCGERVYRREAFRHFFLSLKRAGNDFYSAFFQPRKTFFQITDLDWYMKGASHRGPLRFRAVEVRARL